MRLIYTILMLTMGFNLASADSIPIFLIPGQGSDSTIFAKLTFPSEYPVHHITYITPDEGETMQDYAMRLAEQIHHKEFILIGVSLGGMLATEMTSQLSPHKTIIISSAKHSGELPKRYNFQKKLPIYKLVGPKMNKVGAKVLQPIVEPDRNTEKVAFKAMLDRKDPIFLNRTIPMIINWDRTISPDDIIHIHGDNDHTIPHRNVTCDYLIEDGSHMMTLTRADELSEIIREILND